MGAYMDMDMAVMSSSRLSLTPPSSDSTADLCIAGESAANCDGSIGGSSCAGLHNTQHHHSHEAERQWRTFARIGSSLIEA